MSNLKYTKGEKGILHPGLYIVQETSGRNRKYIVEAGEGLDAVQWKPSHLHLICGPIDIADPDPELELPEGWSETDTENAPIHSTYTIVAQRETTAGQYGIWIYATCLDRNVCIRAINAAMKAAEEEE